MKFRRFWPAVAILSLSLACAAQSGSKQLAVVNGEIITEEQVKKAAAADLEGIELRKMQYEAEHERNKHEVMEKALNGILEEKLLTAEAAKHKITKDALVLAEIDAKVVVPSDEAVKAFYEANKARINVPGDPMPQIRQYLIQEKRTEIRNAYIAKLKVEHKANVLFEPLRIQVDSTGYPARGPANAPVTIVEFSDFECPFCANLFPTMKLLEEKYAGKMRLVYRQYPLTSIHPRANKAAEASLCANDQQKFWQLHDAMFADIRKLGIDELKARAAELKMDTAAFNTCLDSGKHAEAVRKDLTDGVRAGVSGTPALFINGRPLTGAQPFATIAKIIDDELNRAAAKK